MPLDGPLSCEVIWSRWEQVLDGLRVNVRAFLLDAVPTELREDNLVLSFPAKCRFHAGQVKSHGEAIQGALEGVFGKRFALQARVVDGDTVTPPGGAPAAAPAIAEPVAPAPPPGAPLTMPPPAATQPTMAQAPALPEAEMASLEAMAPPPEAPVTPPPARPAAPVQAAAPAPQPAVPEPAAPLSTDEAVAQTLSLFPGSQEVLPPEQNHQ